MLDPLRQELSNHVVALFDGASGFVIRVRAAAAGKRSRVSLNDAALADFAAHPDFIRLATAVDDAAGYLNREARACDAK